MLEIEITKVDIIEGGIEVFARAWNEKGQIGFGADGSVDVERFRIINPPVLVLDSDGDITVTQEADEELGLPGLVSVYREDPEEAILRDIEGTIRVKKEKFDSKNIIPGKVGNTTSTFYPQIDGTMNHSQGGGVGVSWSTHRDAVNATSNNPSATSGVYGYLRSRNNPNYNLMARAITGFDTSSLPDTDVISSATISIYGTASSSAQDMKINTSSITLASDTGISDGDWDITAWGSAYSTGILFSAWNTSGYNDFALNASGRANISKTGASNFGWCTENELTDSEPSHVSNVTSSGAGYFSEQTGTANDPKLVVEHSAAASSSIKEVNGLAIASVKSRNGLAIASVKSINGLSNV